MGNKRAAFMGYLLAAAALLGAIPASGSAPPPDPGKLVSPTTTGTRKVERAEEFGRLPLYFIENRGQVDERVKYYVRGQGQTIYFTREGLTLTVRRDGQEVSGVKSRTGKRRQPPTPADPQTRESRETAVRLTPLGLRRGVKPTALDPQDYRENYFIGNDRSKWRTNIPTYGALVYREAYPGIDLKFYGSGRQLEYDIIVKPGADPNRVRFHFANIKGLELTSAGDLAVKLPGGGELIQKKPEVYQEINGVRVAREGRFTIQGNVARHTYGFAVAAYDRRYPLVIDPVQYLPSHLVWSTYLGGSGGDSARGVALDAGGNVYIAGATASADFPHTNPLYGYHGGECDAFVTKINASGTALVYSTFLGGNGRDFGYGGVKVDQNGNVWTAGATDSTDFPLVNTYQNYFKGIQDVYVAKLNPAGDSLLFSTYFGEGECDGIALDSNGNAFITGYTFDPNFPTKNALQPTKNGSYSGFVSKFSSAGALLFSTYLGGSSSDFCHAIAVDLSGDAYVTGETSSSDFPRQPLQNLQGPTDAFVTKIKGDGSAIVYSTLLGGSSYDKGLGLAVDQWGEAYAVGETLSSDFPAVNPVMSFQGTSRNAFVAKLNASGNALLYSTCLGGSDPSGVGTRAYGVAVDLGGNAYVTGETYSSNFPVLKAAQNHKVGNSFNAFVTKLTPGGNALRYSTYLGGADGAQGYAIAVNATGNAFVVGGAGSGFPIKNAIQAINGSGDAFITKLIANPATLSGLVAFYPLDGDTLDKSGNNRHAEAYGGAGPVTPGYQGGAYGFNGSSAYIWAPVNISPANYPELTMGAWVKPAAITPPRLVLSQDFGGYARSLGIDDRGGGTGWSAFCGTGGVLGYVPALPNQWTFVAVAYNQVSNSIKLWVNDLNPIYGAGELGAGLDSLYIGVHPWAMGYFQGAIDNVFVFNKLLDDDQVAFIRETGAEGIITGIPSKNLAPIYLNLLLSD